MNIVKSIVVAVFLSTSLSLYATGLQGLFGIELNKNINNYVSKNYLEANKYEANESLSGFFSIEITDKVHNKNPFVDDYFVTIDSNNIIQGITGAKVIKNLEICLSQLGNLEKAFVAKYQLNFKNNINDYPTFKIHSRYQDLDNGSYLSLQCHLDYDNNSVLSQVFIISETRSEDIKAYYDSGI